MMLLMVNATSTEQKWKKSTYLGAAVQKASWNKIKALKAALKMCFLILRINVDYFIQYCVVLCSLCKCKLQFQTSERESMCFRGKKAASDRLRLEGTSGGLWSSPPLSL